MFFVKRLFFSKKKKRGKQTGVGKMRAGPSTSRHLNKKKQKAEADDMKTHAS